ncbi:hypothetical protein EV361DRAFT_967065 [Lentinula raphanica]|nr:hypothetical protein F5880DRAFT_140767 [Lentinula raphanica]KAJ3965007.1 hypothetical protein EV361DRAFT_967065 [Lentinula raphanica]
MVHLKSKIFIVFLAANMASVLAIPVPSGSDVGGSHVPVGGFNAGVSGADGAGAVIGANVEHQAQVQQANSLPPREEPALSQWKEDRKNELLRLGYSADSTEMKMLTMTLENIAIGTTVYAAKTRALWGTAVNRFMHMKREERARQERDSALQQGEEQKSRPASPKPGSS